MGLHSPFGYVGYTQTFLRTFIDLLDRFCGSCHTDDDFHKGCEGCPVGQLIYEAKNYVLDAYESEHLKKETSIIGKIKKEIKNIHPSPHFHANWIFDDARSEDPLLELRGLLKDLDFHRSIAIHPFNLKKERREQMNVMLEAEKEDSMKLKKRTKGK